MTECLKCLQRLHPLHPCSYCEILGHGKVQFSRENLLERHGVHKHPGWPIYSKPDIEKFREEQSRKKQQS